MSQTAEWAIHNASWIGKPVLHQWLDYKEYPWSQEKLIGNAYWRSPLDTPYNGIHKILFDIVWRCFAYK